MNSLKSKIIWGASGVLAFGITLAVLYRVFFTGGILARTHQGTACVLHKVNPIHEPKAPLTIFIDASGGEFFVLDKNVFDSMNVGDCVNYTYTEIYNYDTDPAQSTLDHYEYGFHKLQRESGRATNQIPI